jgi:hypothetical protein
VERFYHKQKGATKVSTRSHNTTGVFARAWKQRDCVLMMSNKTAFLSACLPLNNNIDPIRILNDLTTGTNVPSVSEQSRSGKRR